MLSPFIDGELAVAERQTVERHLGACKDCTARVADLRAESALLRHGMELMTDEVDFTGFAQKVMARVTPERPPLMDRVRVTLSELFLYQRGAMMTAMAACAVAVIGVVAISRIGGAPEGYAGERVTVQQVSVGDGPVIKPVVTTTDTGNTILWLVDEPKDEKKKQQYLDEEAEEELGGPRRGIGDAPPRGGDL